jgi:hypothetical protein
VKETHMLQQCVDVGTPCVSYTNQKNAWKDINIFDRWLKEQLIAVHQRHLEENGLPRKIILVDNAPSYPYTEVFIPLNTTTLT